MPVLSLERANGAKRSIMALETILALMIATGSPADSLQLSKKELKLPQTKQVAEASKTDQIIEHLTPSWELDRVLNVDSKFTREHKPTVSINVSPNDNRGFDTSVKITFRL